MSKDIEINNKELAENEGEATQYNLENSYQNGMDKIKAFEDYKKIC